MAGIRESIALLLKWEVLDAVSLGGADQPGKSHLEMLGLERILTWHRMLGSRSGTSTRI